MTTKDIKFLVIDIPSLPTMVEDRISAIRRLTNTILILLFYTINVLTFLLYFCVSMHFDENLDMEAQNYTVCKSKKHLLDSLMEAISIGLPGLLIRQPKTPCISKFILLHYNKKRILIIKNKI